MNRHIFSMFSAVVFILVFSEGTFASDRIAEAEGYIKLLNSSGITKRIEVAKLITNSAIPNSKLYDAVKIKLETSDINSKEKNNVDEIAWLCKALASSGDDKYKPVVMDVAENSTNKKIINYAKQSYELFDEFKHRNDVINDRSKYDSELSDEENRISRMISSESVKLKRDGAKIVFRREKEINTKVFDLISEDLKANFDLALGDKEHVDTVAWFCKALASSGNVKYISTFEEIVSASNNWKIKKFAKQGISDLSGSN